MTTDQHMLEWLKEALRASTGVMAAWWGNWFMRRATEAQRPSERDTQDAELERMMVELRRISRRTPGPDKPVDPKRADIAGRSKTS